MTSVAHRPYGLLAELTHRCPLHCPYCSNPLQLALSSDELSTAEWSRAFQQASELGVLHVGFSGGEPLVRNDLPELVSAARNAGLFTNLITSAVGLTQARAHELKAAGLDSIQISFQSDEAELADAIAGTRAHAAKLLASEFVRSAGIPLSLNVVLHRGNMERLEQIIALAEHLGAERLELANTQYYGWAFKNLAALLPTREQIGAAEKSVAAAKLRLAGKMELIYVLPDYYGDWPKPCMNGWGRRFITIDPRGDVLPCPTARSISTMRFENIRRHDLGWIWSQSESFNCFRGTAWMPEPCQSCDRRDVDFGGCRCQAMLLIGDAAATDPACKLSPHRAAMERLLKQDQAIPNFTAGSEMVFRGV